MIKNYIFDFGNVISEFNPEKMTRPYVDNDEECKIISDIVFDRLYWDRLDAGDIEDEEIKADIKKRLPKELYQKAVAAYDNWIGSMSPVEGMCELIRDIKKNGGRLFLISNISIQFSEKYANEPWIKEIFDLFEGLVFSGVVGLLKPGREIFEHLMNKYDLKAEECIFVDDTKRNIDGAEAVGIKGYLFDGEVKGLREYIGLN